MTGSLSRLTRIKNRLSYSAIGFSLLEKAKKRLEKAKKSDIQIELKSQRFLPDSSTMGVYYDATEDRAGSVFLLDSVSDDMLISTLAHELKHAEQDITGKTIDRNRFSLTENVLQPYASMIYNRFMEADAYTSQFMILKELYVSGDVSIAEPSPFFQRCQRLLDKAPAIVNSSDLLVQRFIFDRFFTGDLSYKGSPIIDSYDKEHLNFIKLKLDTAMSDLQERIGRMINPNAPKQSYSQIFNDVLKEFPQEGLSIENLQKFGETKDGNYLTITSGKELSDPLYISKMSLSNRFRLSTMEYKFGISSHSPRKVLIAPHMP
jgi:hypothetical protein